MSSLARRGLRTSVTAAGLAALGAGLAGPALAAPALPEAPALPTFPALPAAPSLPEITPPSLADAPSNAPLYAYEALQIAGIDVPGLAATAPQLPAGDAFELPRLPMAAPTAPAPDAPAPDEDTEAAEARTLPEREQGNTDIEVQGDDDEATADENTGRDSAMQSLDTGQEMADRARSLTNGNTVAPLG